MQEGHLQRDALRFAFGKITRNDYFANMSLMPPNEPSILVAS